MAQAKALLLKDGIALIHNSNNQIVPTRTSILIQDGKIAKIQEDIEPDGSVDVLNCANKLISPGFIDTHRHGWQTQLKGRHANELLLKYMVTGNAQSYQFSPQAVFYGQLAGMLESIASGTTTVVDHAHSTYSPAHAKLGIAATVSSGIRSVYCYTPISRIKSWNPLTYHQNPLEPWVMETFSELASQGPWGNGRVTLGFAFDLFFFPPEVVKGVFAAAKTGDIKTITIHSNNSPQLGGGWPGGVVQLLKNMDLLDEHILLSHSNGIKLNEVELIKEHGVHISSTPSTELQMAMGRSVCFDDSFIEGEHCGIQESASLGIDCHSNNAASVISEARLGLQTARSHFNEYHATKGKTTSRLPESLSVESAFNLATIKGAEAVRMEKEIGRIAVGFKADLAIFDALSPAMIGAAQHDPVSAIILHSSPADIETVIVDGIVRKSNGKLLDVVVDVNAQDTIGEETLTWNDIAKYVVQSREQIQKSIEEIDFVEATQAIKKIFGVDESTYVDI